MLPCLGVMSYHCPDVSVQFFTMEEENKFFWLEYSCGEDLSGSCVRPLSYTYTPFSIEILNNSSNVVHPNYLQPPQRPTPCCSSEDAWVCPSVRDDQFNTHRFSCALCCDPSSSHLSQCPPVCYSDGLLPQSGPQHLPSHMAASHTWTPQDTDPCHTSSVSRCVSAQLQRRLWACLLITEL